MYTDLTITDDNWSFQRKTEEGNPLGDAIVFNNTDWRLDRNLELQAYVIFEATRTDGGFPPAASFPFFSTFIIPE